MKPSKRPPRVKGRKLNACQRSLAMLRKLGWTCDVAEKYIARVSSESGMVGGFKGGYRKDLLGFIDILAIRLSADLGGPHGPTTLAVQTTSRQQITVHLWTYRRDPELCERIKTWLSCASRQFVIHGWESVAVPKKDGTGDKVQWTVTERVVTMDDLVGWTPRFRWTDLAAENGPAEAWSWGRRENPNDKP